jgi:hypothetical protein
MEAPPMPDKDDMASPKTDELDEGLPKPGDAPPEERIELPPDDLDIPPIGGKDTEENKIPPWEAPESEEPIHKTTEPEEFENLPFEKGIPEDEHLGKLPEEMPGEIPKVHEEELPKESKEIPEKPPEEVPEETPKTIEEPPKESKELLEPEMVPEAEEEPKPVKPKPAKKKPVKHRAKSHPKKPNAKVEKFELPDFSDEELAMEKPEEPLEPKEQPKKSFFDEEIPKEEPPKEEMPPPEKPEAEIFVEKEHYKGILGSISEVQIDVRDSFEALNDLADNINVRSKIYTDLAGLLDEIQEKLIFVDEKIFEEGDNDG